MTYRKGDPLPRGAYRFLRGEYLKGCRFCRHCVGIDNPTYDLAALMREMLTHWHMAMIELRRAYYGEAAPQAMAEVQAAALPRLP